MLSAGSLNDLPLDIKIIIARSDSYTLLRMYIIDDEFRSWLRNNVQSLITINSYISYSVYYLMDIKLEIYHSVTCWYKNNTRHRETGPAVTVPGRQEYWYNGMLHRLDGPAVISDEYDAYYIDGELHRLDGPALIYHNDVVHWYRYGQYMYSDTSWWKKILSHI